MSSAIILPIAIILALLLNYFLKIALSRWKIKYWIKDLIIFFIVCLLVTGVGNILVLIVNSSLDGASGGIGLLGVGIAAAMGVIIGCIFYLLTNLIYLAVRLIRRV
ncbi:Uncharacterised protein [Candidatus Tiddalikarchaeum anstoanum]|nr:Uncharacterised protein [Candidatus Tiddalikarchaeum anstoanum]